MRLREHLTEAIIQPNKKDISIFKKYITDVYIEFIKPDSKYPRNRSGISRAMKQAATKISKSIKDIQLKFKVTKSFNYKGSAMAGDPHEMEIEYNTEDAYGDWIESRYMFDNWLDIFMNIIRHELVHIEQYRRILKNKGDIQKVNDILFSTSDRADNKFQGNMETYLGTHIEIMAHAKQASDHLKRFTKDEIMTYLKNPNGMDDLSMEIDSNAFNNYYEYMKPNYPKVWKKFMKYLVMYINKRKS